jgi:hypothetical protein
VSGSFELQFASSSDPARDVSETIEVLVDGNLRHTQANTGCSPAAGDTDYCYVSVAIGYGSVVQLVAQSSALTALRLVVLQAAATNTATCGVCTAEVALSAATLLTGSAGPLANGLAIADGATAAAWTLASPGTGTLTLQIESAADQLYPGDMLDVYVNGALRSTSRNTGCSPYLVERDFCYPTVSVSAGATIELRAVAVSPAVATHLAVVRIFFTDDTAAGCATYSTKCGDTDRDPFSAVRAVPFTPRAAAVDIAQGAILSTASYTQTSTSIYSSSFITSQTTYALAVVDLPKGGLWRICYCATYTAAGPECDTDDEFTIEAGQLTVRGPYVDQTFSCTAGFACNVGPVLGQSLGVSDFASFLAYPGTCITGDKDASTEIAQGVYKPSSAGSPIALAGADLPKGGLWTMCYCSGFTAAGAPCDEAAEFTVKAGTLTVTGPGGMGYFQCVPTPRYVNSL